MAASRRGGALLNRLFELNHLYNLKTLKNFGSFVCRFAAGRGFAAAIIN
jgi:hypothetical protein